jgi:hypothetical protein
VLRAAGDLFPRRGGLSRVRGNCAPWCAMMDTRPSREELEADDS